MNIPDNLDLFDRYEAAQEAKLMRRPVCICCKNHIQESFYYDFGDGPVCIDCKSDYEDKFMVDIEED